ncbi:MAG: hypothetical protein ABFQ62_00840 [Patescibacteria group bacterium]
METSNNGKPGVESVRNKLIQLGCVNQSFLQEIDYAIKNGVSPQQVLNSISGMGKVDQEGQGRVLGQNDIQAIVKGVIAKHGKQVVSSGEDRRM